MKKDAIKGYDIPLINKAADILRRNPCQKRSATDLANAVGTNSFKLQIGFKKIFGQSIYQFSLGLRLQTAIELLQTTDKTIAEIARKTGFDSRDSFTRCFRSKFSRPPTAWRNEKPLLPATSLAKEFAYLSIPSLN